MPYKEILVLIPGRHNIIVLLFVIENNQIISRSLIINYSFFLTSRKKKSEALSPLQIKPLWIGVYRLPTRVLRVYKSFFFLTEYF